MRATKHEAGLTTSSCASYSISRLVGGAGLADFNHARSSCSVAVDQCGPLVGIGAKRRRSPSRASKASQPFAMFSRNAKRCST